MKMKEFLLAVLIAAGSLQAQVGIDTRNPESKLDVKGDIKIGNEGKTNAQGKEGMMRWNKEKTCFEGHNGKSWECIGYKFDKDLENVLVVLTGKGKLAYKQDWTSDDVSNTSASEKNVIKLEVRGGSKTSLYDPQSGVITIDEEGPYKLEYGIRLVNDSDDDYDGKTFGTFGTRVTVNNKNVSMYRKQQVFKGLKIPEGFGMYDSNYSQVIYLKPKDKIQVRFFTYGTANMNSKEDRIYIDRDSSYIVLKKF